MSKLLSHQKIMHNAPKKVLLALGISSFKISVHVNKHILLLNYENIIFTCKSSPLVYYSAFCVDKVHYLLNSQL